MSTGTKKKFLNKNKIHPIDLVLQGGGSSCAYQAGYLARLLEEDWLLIRNITSTSGGTVNGAALADGINSTDDFVEGRRRATENLKNIWSDIKAYSPIPYLRTYAQMKGFAKSAHALTTIFTPTIFRKSNDGKPGIRWDKDDPNIPEEILEDAAILTNAMRQANPYASSNILRYIVSKHIPDFSNIQRGSIVRLHAGAMNVSHDDQPKSRIFGPGEISPEVIEAATSLKDFFEPIRIDGVTYRDGGYIENPSIDSVFGDTSSPSKLMIALHAPPKAISAKSQIDMKRSMDEYDIMTEQAIGEFVNSSCETEGQFDCHLACYMPPEGHNDSVRMNTEPGYIDDLWEKGYEAAERFLPTLKQNIGHTSTVNDTLRSIRAYERTNSRRRVDDYLRHAQAS